MRHNKRHSFFWSRKRNVNLRKKYNSHSLTLSISQIFMLITFMQFLKGTSIQKRKRNTIRRPIQYVILFYLLCSCNQCWQIQTHAHTSTHKRIRTHTNSYRPHYLCSYYISSVVKLYKLVAYIVLLIKYK